MADRAEVVDALADQVGAPKLTESEIESVLALAAVAAHSSGDRTTAPLATFLAGVAAGQTDDRGTVIDDLRRHVEAVTTASDD